MLPPLVTVDDLEHRLGREFEDAELSRVEAVLDDASAIVRDEAGRLWISPTTGLTTDVPASIRAVVLRIAERAVRNPQALKGESAGDYSYQYADTEGGVHITAAERQLIRRALGRTGLWTQPVERGDLCDWNTLFAEDNYGCELFPLTAEGD